MSTEQLEQQYIDMFQHMRDNGLLITKCNGYNLNEKGDKIYCNKYNCSLPQIDIEIGTANVYICDSCTLANTCFCDDHALNNLYDIHDGITYRHQIICKNCIDKNNISNTIYKPWTVIEGI